MNFFVEEHKNLLIKLIDAGVEFILIGGYAVNFHGYNRTTGDMDIWLRPDNSNKSKLFKVLVDIGFTIEEIDELDKADFSDYLVFSIWEKPYKTDFLTRISGVKFDEAWEQKVLLPLGDKNIPVLHLHHLVLSKISNGRSQDKTDIEELQKIQALKKNKS